MDLRILLKASFLKTLQGSIYPISGTMYRGYYIFAGGLVIVVLWKTTMTKGSYKRKHLVGVFLTVSEAESMIIMVGNRTAGMVLE